jgi:hypothetical protein
MHEIAAQANGPDEINAVVGADEQLLGSFVHGQASDGGDPELAADRRRGLQHNDVHAWIGGEGVCSGQPGDATADDHDLLHAAMQPAEAPGRLKAMRKRLLVPKLTISLVLLGFAAAACGGSGNGGAAAKTVSGPAAPTDSQADSGSDALASARAPAGASGTTASTLGTQGTAGAQGTSGAQGTGTAVKSTSLSGIDDSALAGRDLILHAQLVIHVDNVSTRVAQAERLARSAHGLVANEEVTVDPKDPDHDSATLTIRVPASAYESTLAGLSKLGVRVSAKRSVDDVTEQVVDTSSRIATAKAGISRVRTLLNRASTLGQVISLESELTKRQSDLESLERRLASLRKQVALATIDVTLSASDKVPATEKKKKDDSSGFIGGLKDGWDAFTTAGSALLTAVGAVLPFAALLAVLIAAAMFGRRRRSAHATTPGDGEPGVA